MKVYEVMFMLKDIFSSLKSSEISIGDAKHIDMYQDFRRLKLEGHKIEYVVSYLSEIHKLSRASVFAIIKKFESELIQVS